MAYQADVTALSPDHLYTFDGVYTDSIGSINGTNSGTIATDTAIAEDATNCVTTNGFTDRVTLATATDINNSAQTRKIVAGWFSATSINAHPCRIYGEGTQALAFHFMFAFGNNSMFEVVDSTFKLQIYGPPLVPNRVYHLCGVFEGSAYSDEIKFFVDGIEQFNASPTDRQPSATTLSARGVGIFGDPSGTVGVGGDTVLLQAATNGKYNHWATWNDTILTDSEIKEELFEKGALPDLTITNQTGLNAIADTLRDNAPLCIRLNTGNGTTNLSADNVTFDELASIHIQYIGTGTVNWTNTNGSNASIGSTPNGGTINFINPATLTINGLINGCELRIYDDETPGGGYHDTELDGIETLTGTTFDFDHSGTVNTVLIQMIADGYEEIIQSIVLSSQDQTVALIPEVETNT